MLEPVTVFTFLTGLAVNVSGQILGAAGRKIGRKFEDKRRQALDAAITAALQRTLESFPLDNDNLEHYKSLFDRFFRHETVTEEQTTRAAASLEEIASTSERTAVAAEQSAAGITEIKHLLKTALETNDIQALFQAFRAPGGDLARMSKLFMSTVSALASEGYDYEFDPNTNSVTIRGGPAGERSVRTVRLNLEEVYVDLRAAEEIHHLSDAPGAEKRRLLLLAEGAEDDARRDLKLGYIKAKVEPGVWSSFVLIGK